MNSARFSRTPSTYCRTYVFWICFRKISIVMFFFAPPRYFEPLSYEFDVFRIVSSPRQLWIVDSRLYQCIRQSDNLTCCYRERENAIVGRRTNLCSRTCRGIPSTRPGGGGGVRGCVFQSCRAEDFPAYNFVEDGLIIIIIIIILCNPIYTMRFNLIWHRRRDERTNRWRRHSQ